MIQVAQEFSRFADQYQEYNIIQTQVAKNLIRKLENCCYEKIADIGCGSGALYQNLLNEDVGFNHLSAFDISDSMLELHPQNEKVVRVNGDFNKPDFVKKLPFDAYDIVLSSSALQWSSDIERTLIEISQLSSRFHFAIFTSNTFKTVHQIAQIDSPIYTQEQLKERIEKHFDASFELVQYKLHFDSVEMMLRYIKRSGVSGGRRLMGYKQTKRVLESYPLDYLEFEVLFVVARNSYKLNY